MTSGRGAGAERGPQRRWLLRFLTGIDLLIPALDMAPALVWLPGLVLAATGRSWIVGPTPSPCCR